MTGAVHDAHAPPAEHRVDQVVAELPPDDELVVGHLHSLRDRPHGAVPGGVRRRVGSPPRNGPPASVAMLENGTVRRIVILGLMALLGGAVLPAYASARITCNSGKTVFKRPAVRVFRVQGVYGNPNTEGSRYKAFYMCARGSHRPLAIWGEPYSRNVSVAQYKLVDGRLGFVAYSEGVSNGAGTSVNWVQLPRGPIKEGEIWAREEMPEEEDPGPKVPSEQVDYAIAEDGTVAVAGEADDFAAEAEHPGKPPPHEWEVCVLTVKPHGLSAPKALLKTTSPAEAPVLSSIAINASMVSWRTRAGLAVSLPR